MNEAVGRRWVDRLYDLSNLVDIDLVRKLRPEDDARSREVAPDGARGLNARELRHLDIENANVRSLIQGEFDGLFAVAGFENGNVRRKLLFENLAEVMALGHVIFSNQD